MVFDEKNPTGFSYVGQALYTSNPFNIFSSNFIFRFESELMCYADGSVKTHFKAGKNVYMKYEDFFKNHLEHNTTDIEYLALEFNFQKRLQSWHGK